MNPNTLGQNIKFYRKLKNMTQTDIANKIYMTQQNIAQIENGKVMPPLDTIEHLADTLGISILDLMNDETEYNFL